MAVMIESIGMEMSDEQVLPVVHPLGSPALVIAGAGSGKTRVMTARVMWLIAEGMNPRRIAGITFTNKAADELRHRVGFGNDPNVGPRISTIHSLALSAIRKNPEGFGLAKTVSPLDTSDGMDLMKRLIDRHKKDPLFDAVEPWPLMEKIEYHRARGVGFAVDYTEEVHAAALKAHKGYHVLTSADHALWAEFEQAKTAASLVDFSDMLHLVVRRGRADDAWRAGVQRQFLTVLVDESQDCSQIQWDFIELLLAPDNLNLFAVGDPGQCQPPGTKIQVVAVPPRGNHPAVLEDRPIEDLKDGDRVTVWSKHDQITYTAGREIKVAARPYSGELLRLDTPSGSTECTPNHWHWVRFNKNAEGKYLVYLMQRDDLGFRVGISAFKRAPGKKGGAYGLSVRMRQENADRAWILRVCDSRPEAEAWEEIYSLKYGIPESLFEATVCWHKSQDLIRLIFSHANPEGGPRCLGDHGLLLSHPLAVKGRGAKGSHGGSWRGFFKTAAANIVPGLMDIPVEGRNQTVPITGITRRHYEGLVYSLEVEKDHTYIADGLVVGNSIYAFNGASPEILTGMVESWRGAVPSLYKLEDNYRSLEKIVKFSNGIQQTMTDTVPLTMKHKRDSVEFPGLVRLVQNQTSRDIAQQVAETIAKDNVLKRSSFKFKDNAILVRSKGQIRDVEEALVCRRIPYIIRGGQSLLQTEEARDLFSYLRLIVNPADVTAFGRAVSVPPRKVGIVTVEKLRKVAEAKYGGDLAVAAAKGDGVALPAFGDFLIKLRSVESLSEALLKIINFTDYHELIKDRYRAKRDLIDLKRDNVGKIQEMIAGMVSENPTMTPSDLIFRLTLNGKEEAKTEEGAVVISTIHSAKGLEWPRVYVTNCVEGSLPHQWSSSAKEVEEERRLFYVACTRAKDALYLCVPHLVIRGPNTARVEPSRFLLDLGINV